MMIELLRPLGPELARRWLAALLLVDEGDRAGVVESVERHIASVYGGASPAGESVELKVVHPPTDRGGYVEQVEVTYARAEERGQKRRGRRQGG